MRDGYHFFPDFFIADSESSFNSYFYIYIRIMKEKNVLSFPVYMTCMLVIKDLFLCVGHRR